jgi:hypothetical protein
MSEGQSAGLPVISRTAGCPTEPAPGRTRAPSAKTARVRMSTASGLPHLLTTGLEVPKIGIGGSLSAPPLPHHRTYGSVYGGSRSCANAFRPRMGDRAI